MPLHFNDTLEHAIRKVEENKVELKLNYTRELLAYGDDINLLGENVSAINKITDTIIHCTKDAVFTALMKTAPHAASGNNTQARGILENADVAKQRANEHKNKPLKYNTWL
jgi:hypothetical protein